jgi:hypothetical protein
MAFLTTSQTKEKSTDQQNHKPNMSGYNTLPTYKGTVAITTEKRNSSFLKHTTCMAQNGKLGQNMHSESQ